MRKGLVLGIGVFLIGIVRLPAYAQSSGDVLRHIADCEDDYKITDDSSTYLRCMAKVEDEIDALAASSDAEDENYSGEDSNLTGEGYRTHTQEDIDLVIADGNKEAAADQVMLKVFDATHDEAQAEKAKENAERAFGEIEAAQLAKSNIVTGMALDSKIRSLNTELAPVRTVTIDKFEFLQSNPAGYIPQGMAFVFRRAACTIQG